MHIQTRFIAILAIVILLSPSRGFGQNQFKIPDMNPSRDTGDRSTTGQFREMGTLAPQENQKSTLPPIAPGSLYKNELRDKSNVQPSETKPTFKAFDSQPVPPQPRSSSGVISGSRPSQSKFQGNGPTSTRSQNPVQQLNPSRLTQNMPSASNRNQSGQLDPTGGNRLPPMDLRSEITQRPSPSQTIPVTDSSMANPSNSAPRISNNIADDSQVVPATYSNPIQQNQLQQNQTQQKNTASGSPARKLIDVYDVSSSTRSLPGIPVSLKDLLRTTPPQYRHAMVQQYWVTFFDWATLNNSITYSQWLNQLPNPRMPAEQKLIQTAKSMAKNDIVAAEIQLAKSQSKLQQLSRTNSQDLLPLPLNQPLVSKYKTHYEWYQSRNLIPAKLKGINEMLPRTYQLLDLRAATAAQAKNTRNQYKQAFSSGQANVGDLLESARIWQNAVQSFVSTAVNYNRAISDYALTIAPKQNSLDQIVSMLVAKPKSVNEVAAQNSVLERNTRPTNLSPQTPQQRVAQQPNFNANRANRTQPGLQPNNGLNANQRASSPNTSGVNSAGNRVSNANSLPASQFRSSGAPQSQIGGQGGALQPSSGGGGFKPGSGGGGFQPGGGGFQPSGNSGGGGFQGKSGGNFGG